MAKQTPKSLSEQLFVAIRYDNVEQVCLLLDDQGLSPETPVGDRAWRPLAVAAWDGSLRVAELLIDRGADIESLSSGYTPLLVAASYTSENHPALVELLLRKGARIESRDPEGHSPIWGAVQKQRRTAIEMLLAHGAVIDEALLAAASEPIHSWLRAMYEKTALSGNLVENNEREIQPRLNL